MQGLYKGICRSFGICLRRDFYCIGAIQQCRYVFLSVPEFVYQSSKNEHWILMMGRREQIIFANFICIKDEGGVDKTGKVMPKSNGVSLRNK